MIAQTFGIATPISEVAQLAKPQPLSHEEQLEVLAEETLCWDDDLANLANKIDQYFRARDKQDFEAALNLKQELIGTIKLSALGMGITKEILDSHYKLAAA